MFLFGIVLLDKVYCRLCTLLAPPRKKRHPDRTHEWHLRHCNFVEVSRSPTFFVALMERLFAPELS